MSTSLDRNFDSLANILMQRRQMQAQQVQQDRANRLSDLQLKQLQREDAYQTGLRDVMSNPGGSGVTLSQLQPPQPQQNTLASLAPGNQLPFPQPQASFAPVEAKMTPGQAGIEYARRNNRPEDVIKLVSMETELAKYAAQGDPVKRAQTKMEIEEGAKFFETIKPYAKNPAMLKQIWPQVQQMFPKQTAGILPEFVMTKGNAMVVPFEMNGQIVPNRGVFYDEDGKTHIIDTTPKPDQESLIDKRFANQQKLTQMQIDAQGRRAAADRASAERRANKKDGGKPLPVSALKLQQDSVDAIGTASGIRADLGVIRQQVESGQLKLGPIRNLAGAAANAAGMSTENSRNLATFKNTLEKLRNDSLRLNKGVQTDGDAQRAWNELMNNINDPGVVKQRLAEIDRINERAVVLHQANIDNIRNNYGQAPLDTSAQTGVKPALGKRLDGKGKDTRPPLSAIFGTKKR